MTFRKTATIPKMAIDIQMIPTISNAINIALKKPFVSAIYDGLLIRHTLVMVVIVPKI